MTKFIAMGPNCWGQDPLSPRQALANAKRNMSARHKPADRTTCFIVFKVSDCTTVNDMGGFDYSKVTGHPPELYGHYTLDGRVPVSLT
jgi:hypothetical protein